MPEVVRHLVEETRWVVKTFFEPLYRTGLYCLVVVAFFSMWILPRIFVRFEIRGKERMQWDGRTLYLIRHRNGTLGTFGVQAQLRYPRLFLKPQMYPFNVAKKHHLWFLGPFASCFRIFLLPSEGNSEGRERVFNTEVEILRRREVAMSLFPTGTRDEVGQTEFSQYHSSTAMGRLIRAAKPKVVFIYDDDSHVFTRLWNDLISGRVLHQPLSRLFRRPRVVITVSKMIDTSKTDTEIGRMCHDTNVTAEALTRALWNHHAKWAQLVDPAMNFPKDVVPGHVQSEDFDNMYDGEAY